ncbi:hypothetical protein [Demequina subtropica]|uniref:hypothetical protein n=1 Tax=Demequina subtropica TaxID=1638989 RepID=UPI000781743A|nr:hypothetical protein [Demequina subtropica]
MAEANGSASEDLSAPQRHRADQLAILRSTNPLGYVTVRFLAYCTVVLAVSFVVDGLGGLFALVATNDLLLMWLADEWTISDEDRSTALAAGSGLPFDAVRAVLIVSLIALLPVAQLAATRKMPQGVEAMRKAVLDGPRWQGAWRAAARHGPAVRTAAIIALVTVLTVIDLRHSAAAGWEDWYWTAFGAPIVLLLAFLVDWIGRGGGLMLTNMLPTHLGISGDDVAHAERDAAAADEAAALLRWPAYPETRFVTAARVFASPPPPSGRRERRRVATWTGTPTSVEALATELVVGALLEARERGYATVSSDGGQRTQVTATLPQGLQPEGLAALVVGRHPEGMAPGRTVDGRLPALLSEMASVDPHGSVIRLALADLESLGVAAPHGNSWELSAELLAEKEASGRCEGGSVPPRHAPLDGLEIARLRKEVAHTLRRTRTSDAYQGEGPVGMLSCISIRIDESHQRSGFQLPGWTSST